MKPNNYFLKVLCTGCIVTLLLSPALAQDDDEEEKFDFAKELEQTNQLIVMLSADYDGIPEYGAGIICGRAKDRLLIATAYHILHRGNVQPKKVQVKFRFLPEKVFEATMVHHGTENEMDLALLQINNPEKQGIKVCDIAFDRLSIFAPQRGYEVFPIGNPNGAPWAIPVTADKISQISDKNLVFQSSFISSGHSGGGLIDGSAGLIGMTVADEPPFGRAISIKAILKTIKGWGYKTHLDTAIVGKKTYLHLAAEKGDVTAIKELLTDCGNPNAPDFHNATPLHYAALSGNIDAVNTLLKAGADINTRDGDGDPPMEYAIEKKHIPVIKLLIDAGADIKTANNRGRTLLDIAAGLKQEETVRLLMKAGSSINTDNDGTSPALQSAVESGNLQLVKDLVQQGAKADMGLLYNTIKDRKTEMLKALLKAIKNINQVYYGETLLHTAVQAKQLEIVKTLVAAGIAINTLDDENKTALYMAMMQNESNTASAMESYLMSHGATIKGAKPLDYEYLLRNAVTNRNLVAVKMALAEGADADHFEDYASFPSLKTAIQNGDIEIIKALLQTGVNVNGDRGGAFDAAMKKGNIEILQLLIAKAKDADKAKWADSDYDFKDMIEKGNLELFKVVYKASSLKDKDSRLLDMAIKANQQPIVNWLLNTGAKSNAGLPDAIKTGNTIIVKSMIDAGADKQEGLQIAIENGQPEMVNLFVQAGANTKKALPVVIEKGHLQIFEILMAKGIDPNEELEENDKPLHLAAEHGQVEMMKYLLKMGANKNGLANGQTPLRRAIEKEQLASVQLLIQSGVNVNDRKQNEEAPLYTAVIYDDPKIFQALLDAKANVQVDNGFGYPILHFAASVGSTNCVQKLLKAGSNVNLKDQSGKSALHAAIESNNENSTDVVRILIDAKADVNIKDQDGKTPLAIAMENDKQAILRLLKAAGAK